MKQWLGGFIAGFVAMAIAGCGICMSEQRELRKAWTQPDVVACRESHGFPIVDGFGAMQECRALPRGGDKP